jgi:acetyl-CoA carboxylase carboxyl transferase subunit beta
VTWFSKMAPPPVKGDKKASVPSGVWRRCEGCGASRLAEEVTANLEVCPECGHHLRIGARARLLAFLDEGSAEELAQGLLPGDPLEFADQRPYPERVESTARKVGEEEAFVLMQGALHGRPVVAGAFEFRFMGGSMGSVVGEKVARAFEVATLQRCPVVLFSASGGARMQEGILSLMQMAKTSSAIHQFRAVKQPYISVLTDPTTGGVAASFSLLGDVILAEPGALVGFAGPRVIEQTIRQTLPEGFQRAEFLLEHGVIDRVVPRGALRDEIGALCGLLAGPTP